MPLNSECVRFYGACKNKVRENGHPGFGLYHRTCHMGPSHQHRMAEGSGREIEKLV